MPASGGRMGGRASSPSSSSGSSSGSSPCYSCCSYHCSCSRRRLYSYSSASSPSRSSSSSFWTNVGVIVLSTVMIFALFGLLEVTEQKSVLKLQVGLSGTTGSLQKDLDRIAEVADTSTSKGLSYVLTETTLALLRQLDCAAYSSVDVKSRVGGDGEKIFNQFSVEERAKFDEETLVNVNNIKMNRTSSQKSGNFSNEFIVVTILVDAKGMHKIPEIKCSADLKEALQKLGSMPSRKILAVEVLWTPQNENDRLTERELFRSYPLLSPL